MDHPHLVASAAGGDVEALLEKLLVAHGQRPALSRVYKRDKDDVALIALELRGVAAEQAVELVAIGRDMRTQQVVDLERLFIADKRHDAEAERLTCTIVLILALLHRRGDERSRGQGFLAIDLAVAAGTRNAIGHRVRKHMHTAGVAQGLDAPIVGNHVAELNDFRDATEMLDKTSRAAERLPRQVVNRDLAVVQIGVRDALQVLKDEVLNDAEILADSRRADLFVVPDDEHGFAEIEGRQRHDVALAGLVDDDHVEPCQTRIEILDDSRERHDPDRNGAATLGHLSGGFRAKQRNANAVALADSANGVEPADQRLPLARRSAVSLPGPGPAVDQVDRHAAKMLAELFDFRLQRFEGNLGAAIEFVIELAPNPGGGRIARRLAAAMHTGAIANRRGPRRRRALQFAEEPAAKIEVRLAALQFKKKIISFAIGAAILFVNGFLQLDEDLGCAGAARGGLVAALQIAKFSFELEHPQFFVARV